MRTVTLGNTGIVTDKNGFGALPIQRIGTKEAVYLLHKAFDAGITYYDSARAYTDSEEKLGLAFAGRRDKVFLATKTMATDLATVKQHLDTSLRLLKTDYIDVYQLHNYMTVPRPGGEDGIYDYLCDLRESGIIRHIGLTAHRLAVAQEAVESDLYDTLQFPLSYLSDQRELDLVERCAQKGVGFVAMKGLAGGLLVRSAAAYAFLDQFPNVLPIWGIQRERELDEFISYIHNPPAMDAEMRAFIEGDREKLAGDFCRACGYCAPCPVGIEIHTCARLSLFIRRAPSQRFLEPEFQAEMAKIDDCIHCNQCAEKCPYELDPPALLVKSYDDYKEILAGRRSV